MMLTDQETIQINQALFSITHAYESRMEKENPSIQSGLTLLDCAVLMVIGQFSTIQSSELSHRMDVSASTISIYVKRLTKKELVCTDRNPQDRRVWRLKLTENGLLAYQQILMGTILYTKDFLSVLTEGEQHEFSVLIRKISHALGFTWQ